MSMPPTQITFFEFLTPLILSGKKTITIRDASESHYQPNTEVNVLALETKEYVGRIKILSVTPIHFDEINQFHAEQEAMSLSELKELIRKIYPENNKLYVISYELVA